MPSGRQWIALDADYFSAPFVQQLRDRFGWAGVGVFTAFLCACKRGFPQGELSYSNDNEALMKMGVLGWPLVDDDGKPWQLDDLWKFAGRMKQTRRKHARHSPVLAGTRQNVRATHWERWQKATKTDEEQARKRMWEATNRVGSPSGSRRGRNGTASYDSEGESEGARARTWGTPQSSNGNDEELKDLRSAVADVRGALGWVKPEDADAPT